MAKESPQGYQIRDDTGGLTGWCGCIWKIMKGCQILVIAEPTYSKFIFKIVDQYTLATLYDHHIRYGDMGTAMREGYAKAIEMGFAEQT